MHIRYSSSRQLYEIYYIVKIIYITFDVEALDVTFHYKAPYALLSHPPARPVSHSYRTVYTRVKVYASRSFAVSAIRVTVVKDGMVPLLLEATRLVARCTGLEKNCGSFNLGWTHLIYK